jgi:hypothetical protein
MSDEVRAGSIQERIESLRARQEYHERLAREHRETAIRIWRQRAALELSADEEPESLASSEKNRRRRVHGR